MKNMRPISEEERSLIRERLFVDNSSPTGLSRIGTGKTAGSPHTDRTGYKSWQVQVGKRTYRAHRLVWLLSRGFDCLDTGLEIDHRDTDATNNNPSNLRLATDSTQSRNQKKRSNTTSNLRFVRWHKRANKWGAQYSRYWSDKKSVWVGTFESEFAAHHAALAHRLENHWISC